MFSEVNLVNSHFKFSLEIVFQIVLSSEPHVVC